MGLCDDSEPLWHQQPLSPKARVSSTISLGSPWIVSPPVAERQAECQTELQQHQSNEHAVVELTTLPSLRPQQREQQAECMVVSGIESQLNAFPKMLTRVEEAINDGMNSNSDGIAPAREDEERSDGVNRSGAEMPPPPKLPQSARCDRRVVKRVVRPVSRKETSGISNSSCSESHLLNSTSVAPLALAVGKQRSAMASHPHQPCRNLSACASGQMKQAVGFQVWSGSPSGRLLLKGVTITRYHYLEVGL